jgi:hypothetical protein
MGKIAYRETSEVALSVHGGRPYNDDINLEARMNALPFLSVTQSCGDALQWTKEQLRRVGLRPVQTLDLNAARRGLHECACPNHGTDACNCQMVILLVYGDAPEPLTLILHGNDGKTWFSIAEDPRQSADVSLYAATKQALHSPIPLSHLE